MPGGISYWKRAGLPGGDVVAWEILVLIKGNNCCSEVKQVLKGRGNLYPAANFKYSILLAAHLFLSPTLIILI